MQNGTRAVLTGLSLLALTVAIERPVGVSAQSAAPSVAPLSGQAVAFGVSPAVSTLMTPSAAFVDPDLVKGGGPRRRIRNPVLPKAGAKPSPDEGLDLAVQTLFPALNIPMPAPLFSVDGLSNLDNANAFGFRVSPPDTDGDVGPNHFVQQTNLLVRVFNKSGAPLSAAFKLSNLFAPLGGACANADQGDPVVLYDPLADRWLLSQFGFTSTSAPPYFQCIAVSQTSDPTGAYYVWAFQVPNAEFPDYPKIGVWTDGYYMSVNQFLNGGAFDGTGAYAFNRAKMLAGDPTANFVYFNLNLASHPEGIGGALPSDLDGFVPPPAGAPNVFSYFLATEFGDAIDGLRFFDFHADFTTPANSTFTERTGSPLAVAAFDPRTPTGRTDIPQPAPATSLNNLDSLGDRLMFRLQYRNRGGFESLVATHSVDADPSATYRAGVRYYELRRTTSTGPFSIYEQATYSPDATNRWLGSVATDNQGNLAVGYSVSSASLYPGIRYAGRLSTDPIGGLTQTETDLVAGSGVQLSTGSRWGDYAALTVDPTDDCTFYFTSEYYTAASQATSTVGWLTRIGAFRFAQCTPAPQGTLSGTITQCSNGSPVQNALVAISDGHSRQSSGAGTYSMPLAPGTYTLTVSATGFGPASQSVTVTAGATTTADQCLGGVAPLPTVTVVATDPDAAEAGLDPGSFTISRTGSTTAALSVSVALSGTATNGSDYTTLSSPVTIPAGSASAVVTVTPIDDTTVESNETVVLTLSANAAYTVGAPSSATVTIVSNDTASPTADLIESSLSAPSLASPGQGITVSDTAKNQGTGQAGASVTRLLLSTDAAFSANDVVLGTRNVPTLAAGKTSKVSTAVTIPAGTTPGRYYLLAQADSTGVVGETNETNNVKSRRLDVGADFQVSALSAPASAARGATISINVTTLNDGAATTVATTTRIYYSANSTVDASDTLLATVNVPALASKQTFAATVSGTIPVTATTGNRRIIAVSDAGAVVLEYLETNNTRNVSIAIQ